MYKVIEVGEHRVGMCANAATPYRFKQVFKKDLLQIMLDENSKDEEPDDVMKLAYIMTMQASKKDLTTINEESYIEWLEQFDLMDLYIASGEIMSLYQGNKKSEAEQKKTTPDRAANDDAAISSSGDTDGNENQRP